MHFVQKTYTNAKCTMKDVLIITCTKCSSGFNAHTELLMHTSTEVLYGSALQQIHSTEWMSIKKVQEWQQENTKKHTTLQDNASVMHSARNSLGYTYKLTRIQYL